MTRKRADQRVELVELPRSGEKKEPAPEQSEMTRGSMCEVLPDFHFSTHSTSNHLLPPLVSSPPNHANLKTSIFSLRCECQIPSRLLTSTLFLSYLPGATAPFVQAQQIPPLGPPVNRLAWRVGLAARHDLHGFIHDNGVLSRGSVLFCRHTR